MDRGIQVISEPRERSIGQRIRDQRTASSLSLRQLARMTDLTASYLSQVERGQATPSIGTLRRIADALDLSILNFFVNPIEETPVVRKDTRPKVTIPDSGMTYELVTPKSARSLEVCLCRIEPGAGSFVRRLREPTEECLLVLSGTVIVELATGEYTLQTGDSICFEGAFLRDIRNASDEESVYISVITPPVF